MNTEEIAKIFKALSDKRRINILRILQQGETCVCELQKQCDDLTQSGLSYHLKLLSDAGFLHCRHEGKWCHYSIALSGKEHAISLLNSLLKENEDKKDCCNCKKNK